MYYPHTSIEILFESSFKGLVALEITSDLPFGFPINNIISFDLMTDTQQGRSAVKKR